MKIMSEWISNTTDKIEAMLLEQRFKHTVELTHPKQREMILVWDWLREEIGTQNYYFRWHLDSVDTIEYRFKKHEDAVMFKLRWS